MERECAVGIESSDLGPLANVVGLYLMLNMHFGKPRLSVEMLNVMAAKDQMRCSRRVLA